MKRKKEKEIVIKRSAKYTRKLIKRNWLLYVFLVPAFAYLLIFNYAPMFGLVISFENFSISKGYFGSPWVGFKWFEKFFSTPRFWTLIKNTLTLSAYSILCNFPIAILLALMVNSVKNLKWKKAIQTITYMPHFISTVVLVGMMSIFFSPRNGIINTLLSYVGGSGTTYFMGMSSAFKHLYVWSGVWQSSGWNAVIYIAALAGVDPTLYEAAMIDGANKFKRILYVDLPCIMPTISVMLIMNFGKLMSVGYEKVYLLQNHLNVDASEVISTYVYKMGLLNSQYSYSTAIGLFNNALSFLMLIFVNKIVKKLSGAGLW